MVELRPMVPIAIYLLSAMMISMPLVGCKNAPVASESSVSQARDEPGIEGSTSSRDGSVLSPEPSPVDTTASWCEDSSASRCHVRLQTANIARPGRDIHDRLASMKGEGVTSIDMSMIRKGLRGAHIAPLGELESLQDLDLSNTSLTDEAWEAVKWANGLRTLDVSHTNSSEKHLYYLHMPGLQKLDVSGNRIGEGGEEVRLYDVPELRDLNLSFNPYISMSSLPPKLATLDLSRSILSEDTIRALLDATTLRQLDLSHTNIEHATLEVLKSALPDTKIIWSKPTIDCKKGDIALRSDGYLTWGTHKINIEAPAEAKLADAASLGHTPESPLTLEELPCHEEEITLEVRKLDKRRRVLYAKLPGLGTEDPPARQLVFMVIDGSLRKTYDGSPGVYGTPELTFHGDGRVSRPFDEWEFCMGSSYEKPVKTQRPHEVFRFNEKKGLLESVAVERREKYTCEGLSACPFVWVEDDRGREVFVGEILRDLRGEDAYALQELKLGATSRSKLRVRLSEEKPERTFLDELYVIADGERILPDGCEMEAGVPAWCEADERAHVIEPDASISFTFSLGEGGARAVTLWARGYYITLPTKKTPGQTLSDL